MKRKQFDLCLRYSNGKSLILGLGKGNKKSVTALILLVPLTEVLALPFKVERAMRSLTLICYATNRKPVKGIRIMI